MKKVLITLLCMTGASFANPTPTPPPGVTPIESEGIASHKYFDTAGEQEACLRGTSLAAVKAEQKAMVMALKNCPLENENRQKIRYWYNYNDSSNPLPMMECVCYVQIECWEKPKNF